jgi:hypothetical protein
VTPNFYASDGDYDLYHFPVGVYASHPPIKVIQWNTATSVSTTGSISTADYTAGTARIEFTAAAPWGATFPNGATWRLELNDWTSVPELKGWIWIADTNKKVFGATQQAFRIK